MTKSFQLFLSYSTQIVSVDEDTARVVLRMAINNQVSQCLIQVVVTPLSCSCDWFRLGACLALFPYKEIGTWAVRSCWKGLHVTPPRNVCLCVTR